MTVSVRLLWRRDGDALAETVKAWPTTDREAEIEGAAEGEAEGRRPPASLARIALPLTVLVVGLLAGAVWYVWASYRTIDHLRSVEMPLAALGNEIAYQAAAMRLAIEAAAATGDAAWEGRYRASAERLDRALARVREIAPGIFSTGPHAETLTALRALRTHDRRLFTLLRAGQTTAATRVIAGRGYRLARDGASAAIAAVVDAIARRTDAALRLSPDDPSLDATVAGAAVAVLLAAWFVLLRLLGQATVEARAADAAGRRERAFAEALADTTRALVMVLDREGRILRANSRLAALAGRRPSELRGRRWPELFGEGGGARAVVPGFATGERRSALVPFVTRDGSRRMIAWSDRILRDDDGEPVALVAVGEDVTDACHVEHERRARAKAERANRAKSRFLAAASHDLRQPLQAARLFVAALRNRASDAASCEIVDRLDEAMASTENLLNALLDLSRLDAGALEPEIEDTPIGPLLRRLAASFRPQAEAKGVALRVVDSSAWVRSDPVLLENILRNLIANAVRYTPKGRILIGCRRRGDTLAIEVWDTGEGIAEEQHAAIFEEFRQLGAPERDHTRGLGLGLAIVDRMCRLLGHRVSLRSTPGRGSVFAVAVPRVAKAAPAAPAPRIETEAGFAGLPVLVVEDEPRQRASLALLLGDWGCRVEIAVDGEAALRSVEAGFRPALVIADLHLPGDEDGVATVAALRRRLGRRLPALIVTGDTEPAALRAARRDRLTVLRKPVEARRLHAALSGAFAEGHTRP